MGGNVSEFLNISHVLMGLLCGHGVCLDSIVTGPEFVAFVNLSV